MQTPDIITPNYATGDAAARIRIDIPGAPTGLRAGLAEIQRHSPWGFTDESSSARTTIELVPDLRGGLTIDHNPVADEIRVQCGNLSGAFRALGIILGRLRQGQDVMHREHKVFESLGVMIDVSRNGVMRPETIRKLIRHLALMGIDRLMLYTEDTYEIPGEPLFGYFRGGYTQAELRAFDDYAVLFGIEIVPCIQTLGHLEQILQWPAYRTMQDAPGVLLAGDASTDDFVEKMIAAATAPFRSNRIHLGMDEAHGIGSGRYRVLNGLRSPFDILTSHLSRTGETCRRLGLQPMVWSDMFFRLGSKDNDYYDRSSVIDPETIKRVPADVDLVYWDYYHTDESFYDEWIARHRTMGKEPIFAGGVWTWNRWWAQLPHTFATLRAGMSAARKNRLKEALVTIWGDDGMECDVFSALAGIQYFAELGHGKPDEADRNLSAHFRGSSDAAIEKWVRASNLDLVPDRDPASFYHANPSKWLLWHDPLLGFLDQHIPDSFAEHYLSLAEYYDKDLRDEDGDAGLEFVGRVAAVLGLKCRLHCQLRTAYQQGDFVTLGKLLEDTIPDLQRKVIDLKTVHENRWHETYRAFGWEVVERRYAGLLSRLETLLRKLRAHLKNPDTGIEELECASMKVWPEESFFRITLSHRQTATPSFIG